MCVGLGLAALLDRLAGRRPEPGGGLRL
jgi:hypothetical protein